jgi:amino acid transporter
MASVAASDLVDFTTTDVLEEKKKLRKHFARFDILFFLICTLVGVDTLGAVASNGPQAFTWLIFLAVLFFVPYALLTAELGAAFPEEGGPYIWTRLAWGRGVAAVNGLIYWVSNPIWVGGTLGITALTDVEEFFKNGSSLPGAKISFLGGATVTDVLFVLVFIWLTIVAAIVSFSIGKWVPTIGAFMRALLLGFFTITVVIYAIKNGVHDTFGGSSFLPSYAIFIAGDPPAAAQEPDHRPDGIPGRHQVGVHRIRRAYRGERDSCAYRGREGARLRDRGRVRPGAADQRSYLDHGRGPGPSTSP